MVLAPGEPSVAVRWFFAPPGAKWLGIPNAFTSATWDAAHGLGPYPLGEVDDSSTWDKGVNTGNYAGQCRVGTDDEYLNGANPAPLIPLPLPPCCQTEPGKLFYLRSALSPIPPALPSGLLAAWKNQGSPAISQFALSESPGGGPLSSIFNFAGGGPFVLDQGDYQYITPPLGPGTLSARNWQLSLGYRCTARPGGGSNLSWRVAVILCDSTGALKELVVPPIQLGLANVLAGPYHSGIITFPGPLFLIAAGDYLVVEVGVHAAYPLHPPTRFTGQFWDSGTTPITAPDVGAFNPAAALDYRG